MTRQWSLSALQMLPLALQILLLALQMLLLVLQLLLWALQMLLWKHQMLLLPLQMLSLALQMLLRTLQKRLCLHRRRRLSANLPAGFFFSCGLPRLEGGSVLALQRSQTLEAPFGIPLAPVLEQQRPSRTTWDPPATLK